MFYIIAQGARISTPIDQLLKSTNISPIAASTAVKAVSTHSDKVAEKNLSKKTDIYQESQSQNRQSSERSRVRYAREIMTSPVVTASVRLSLNDTWKLLAAKGFHHLPIVDDRQQLQGIVSDRDLLRYAANDNRQVGGYSIEQLMTREVISADANAGVRLLAEIMCSRAIGSIPIVLDIKNKGIKIESGKATLVAGIIMILFLFFGDNVLALFGVDVNSFAVAGSLILFFLGIEMVLGVTLFKDVDGGNSGSIVPIAFPIIAGAGTMTTIISLRAEYETMSILVSILINVVIIYFILRSSNFIGRKIGKSGLAVLRKVFGIILLSIAIKLFKENIIL